MTYYVVRIVFLLVFIALTWQFGDKMAQAASTDEEKVARILGGIFLGFLFGGVLIAVEAKFARDSTYTFFGVIAGLLLGLLISVVFVQVISFLPDDILEKGDYAKRMLISGMVAAFCCYLCIILVLRVGNKYRVIFPFVELRPSGPQRKRLVLDTSAIIDGRIAEIAETGTVDQTVYLPDFVLQEVHEIADSQDRLRRARGRRGLEMLNRLRNNSRIQIDLLPSNQPENLPTDHRLITLAREVDGRIITSDNNLDKIARLQDIDVLNLNELAAAMRVTVLPGESLILKLLRPGEESDQAIGYLEDGTMVVVKGGRQFVGEEVGIVVTSVLQKSTGRMIFAAIDSDDLDDQRSGDATTAAGGDVFRDSPLPRRPDADEIDTPSSHGGTTTAPEADTTRGSHTTDERTSKHRGNKRKRKRSQRQPSSDPTHGKSNDTEHPHAGE